MTIPDPDKIWPKLESTGVEEVRKRLAMGAYAKNKVPVVEEWLRRKEESTRQAVNKNPTSDSQEEKYTKVDRFFSYAKNHPILSVLLIVGAIVIGIANFTDAVSRLTERVQSWQAATSLSTLPGETGWIFAGYFDMQRETFIEGPYVSVVDTSRRGMRRFVEVGDTIRLNVSRRVYIVDFANMGPSKKLVSPRAKGVISKSDETGVVLPAETELVVRDVSEGHWPDNPNAALWLRVVDAPK